MHVYLLRLILSTSFLILLSSPLLGFTKGHNETEQQLYFVSIEFSTSTVKVGRNSMKLFIGDRKSRKPVKEKLEIEVVPWIPADEHGMDEIPVIKELGRGEYLVERLNFTMPGDWEIYVRINKGKKGEDTAVFNVSVVK